MKIYNESDKEILISQTKDPLLNYLTLRIRRLAKRYIICGGRIIDLGCGVGRTSTDLTQAGFIITGIDINETAIAIAKKRLTIKEKNSIRYLKADTTKKLSKKQKGKFDGVICSEVIEHVHSNKRSQLLANTNYLLKKRGCLILTAPHDPKQWSVLDEYAKHTQRFTVDQITTSLESHGFRTIKIDTIGFPFTRLLILLYNQIIKFSRKKHSFKNYGQSFIYLRIYIPLVSSLLIFDSLFDQILKGTTIVVVAEKK